MLLGDMIATMTGWMGIKPCEPCKQRQASLNNWHAQVTGKVPPRPAAAPIETFVIEVSDGHVVTKR